MDNGRTGIVVVWVCCGVVEYTEDTQLWSYWTKLLSDSFFLNIGEVSNFNLLYWFYLTVLLIWYIDLELGLEIPGLKGWTPSLS